MLRTSSILQFSLILLIFANLLVSGLSESNDGESQPKNESNSTSLEVTKSVNESVTVTQNEQISNNNETKNNETVKLDEVDAGVEANNSEIESSSIKSTTSTTAKIPETNIGTVSENKTEPPVIITTTTTTTTKAAAVLPENVTEISTTLSNNDSTEKNKATQEKLAADNTLGPKPKDMSSGAIALTIVLSFAIVVIIVYVGLLGWRRYLEYRYGNRELLVDNLEFDTNDLRHFEL